MGLLFGTDGIRGIANKDLDSKLAFKVGMAAALALSGENSRRPVFTIGKDTRISSDMLEAALTAGLCAAGADVMPLGVIPTPAVAFITVAAGADAGIVISASHNPYEYNGIKIFNSEGFKLSDELEKLIESYISSGGDLPVKTNGAIGKVLPGGEDWANKYIEHTARCKEGEINALKVVFDCANGAASRTARKLFSRFDIDYTIINDSPDGVNINKKCGSTHMKSLAETVVEGGFDLGIAFDGDADRCLVVDEKGSLVDGDRIMGICGKGMKDLGKLNGDTIVATVMSNIGFHKFAKSSGLNILCANVGDKYVLRMMQEGGFNLGGEQSGHMIFLGDSTTGDGQLTAVKFLSIVSASGKTVSELVTEIPQFPQILQNVIVEGGNAVKNRVLESEVLLSEIKTAEDKLGDSGRILVRPSGTEALIRVMVEAAEHDTARNIAEKISNTIKTIIKLSNY